MSKGLACKMCRGKGNPALSRPRARSSLKSPPCKRWIFGMTVTAKKDPTPRLTARCRTLRPINRFLTSRRRVKPATQRRVHWRQRYARRSRHRASRGQSRRKGLSLAVFLFSPLDYQSGPAEHKLRGARRFFIREKAISGDFGRSRRRSTTSCRILSLL